MFSVRIVTTDHYQGPPIPGLDVQYADFRALVVKRVPVIRVFGSTPQGMLIRASFTGLSLLVTI